MAVFSKLVITRKGQALLAKILSGVKNVNFTSVSASNAEYTVEQLENLIALSDIKQTSLISEKVRASDITVKIDAAFNNFELESGYYMRTIGLYADDPDEGEILYGAAIETSGNCYIPPYNGITVSGTYIQLVITVGNAENVSLEVNPGAIATIKQVNNLAEIINAHIPTSVCTLKGVHDLRYYESKLQVYDSQSETWGDASGAVGGVGENVEGQTFITVNGEQTALQGAEIFNLYGKGGNVAIGLRSHAENSNTSAIGNDSHAGGLHSIAKGSTSFSHGNQTKSNGNCSVSFGHSSKAEGFCSCAIGNQTIANRDYTFATGQMNKDFNEKDYFIVGNGNENYNGVKSNCFRVSSYGVYAVGEYTASGADYAEMFEWADGNPDNEDRRGLFVTLDGEKVRTVNENDDYMLGVVSATPSIVADAQTDDWGKKWKTDIFGERLIDENGAWILNDDFREEDNESYVSRLDRKEWAAIGLVGKLIVVDDGTCEVNGYCKPANGGIATKAETGYRVLSRVDINHIKILIK